MAPSWTLFFTMKMLRKRWITFLLPAAIVARFARKSRALVPRGAIYVQTLSVRAIEIADIARAHIYVMHDGGEWMQPINNLLVKCILNLWKPRFKICDVVKIPHARQKKTPLNLYCLYYNDNDCWSAGAHESAFARPTEIRSRWVSQDKRKGNVKPLFTEREQENDFAISFFVG